MSGRTVLAAGALTAAVCGGLALGTPPVPPAEFADAFVVTELRLPRLVLALIAGACLGAAGLVLQEALRNPLAVPELLGVSSGAALAVAGPLVLAVSVPLAVQPFLAIGGAAAGGALTLLAAGAARGPSAVLLCGAAVAAGLQSALLVLMVLADQLDLQLIHRYLLGSLSARTWDDVTELTPWLVAAVPALVLCAPVLSVLRLGDDDARALGVRVHRARTAALAVAVVLIAPVVAVCGPVAWVGFLAPHLARRLAPGKDAVGWLPWSAVWGALIVAWADLPARLALAPVETPVGAWTALLGVPAGVLLLKRPPAADRSKAPPTGIRVPEVPAGRNSPHGVPRSRRGGAE
ncbi:FecCD family ABC transporter permease [Streptomyces tsukubensis]|uniref:Iron ABC transporter n=1 Tax=Streptomyces tsukubensis (strain DSM 42081 / NBRC 108919 / NRRL 18488 / 9993) TaxID=1114943 RepID=A0A7G3UKM6_STRT9|nr:iron ABC transporter permease [Streptomyces tsukubensis]AZK92892.1 iron ABC transporter [Streptomyces tsukubensis]QKM70947.1 iron ABC transporter [Streptomyces tsukubensis NRRL18488]TAI41794.1 iron ABC transporter permease [Streptomyces tsukubensis]